jgi:hypothetical protein
MGSSHKNNLLEAGMMEEFKEEMMMRIWKFHSLVLKVDRISLVKSFYSLRTLL